jgi:hypothetical protein
MGPSNYFQCSGKPDRARLLHSQYAEHAISTIPIPIFSSELTETVRKTLSHERHVHLILENGKPPRLYHAQWNDDYSGRSEAGLVMASTGKVDTGTRAPLSATLMGYKESK